MLCYYYVISSDVGSVVYWASQALLRKEIPNCNACFLFSNVQIVRNSTGKGQWLFLWISNHVTLLNTVSRNGYFWKNVVHKPIKFWQIIKPYMTGKIQANDHKDLMHDNEINDDRLSCFQDDIIKRVAANSSEVNVSNFSSGTVKGIHNLLTIWVGKRLLGMTIFHPKYWQ